MKSIRIKLLILICFGTVNCFAQPGAKITITYISGFPAQPDTSYEGVIYPVEFSVKNTGTQPTFGNDTLEIWLQNDSANQVLHRVASVYLQSPLLPNDSSLVSNPTYQFSPLNFKAGGNIVVVWPKLQSSGVTTPADSISLPVYFVPLQTLDGSFNAPDNNCTLFPVPASNILFLHPASLYKPDCVRIFDLSGRQVSRIPVHSNQLNVANLSAGVYLAEIYENSLLLARRKIIVQ